MNSIDLRQQNDLRGLTLVFEYGWLRARELGAFMWPRNSSSAEAANRLVRSWEKRKLVLVRELPERSGKAIVLALSGVRLLAEHGYHAKTGKDIGTTTEKGWIPPHSWRHDLIATGVLAEFHKRGYSVIPEQTLRRSTSTYATKLPDGLLCGPTGEWIWLEVEHAKKTGRNMRDLAKALAYAAAGEIKEVGGKRCTQAMAAYTDNVDTRGYTLNHRARLIKAISEQTRKTVDVTFAYCEMKGSGVKEITLATERIEPAALLEVLRVMNAGGWHASADEAGVFVAVYSHHKAYVWEYEKGTYAYQVNDMLANFVSNITEAKLACARTIASLCK